MRKFETIFLLAIVLGLLLKFTHLPGASILIVVCFSVLAVFYQYFSFAFLHKVPLKLAFKKESYPPQRGKTLPLSIFSGIALSVSAVALMFKLQHWPGANVLLMVGIFANALSFGFAAFLRKQNDLPMLNKTLVRNGLATAFCLVFFIFGTAILLDFNYRNHPDYIQATKDLQASPTDPVLLENYQREFDKMRGNPQD